MKIFARWERGDAYFLGPNLTVTDGDSKTAPKLPAVKRANAKKSVTATPAGLTPCLWFDKNAREAAKFYVSVFPRSKVTRVQKAPADYPNGKKGDVLTVDLTILGQPFTLLNGGPEFKPSEAASFMIDCKDQEEMDRYYARLSAVPASEICGWIKDKYGVSWQLVPRALTRLLADRDPAKAQRVMEALLDMKRLDVVALEAAGRTPRSPKAAQARAA